MANDMRPLNLVLRELKPLLEQKSNGVLFIVTDDNRFASICTSVKNRNDPRVCSRALGYPREHPVKNFLFVVDSDNIVECRRS